MKMRKTLSGLMLVLMAVLTAGLAGCAKDDFISEYSDTYSTYTLGNTEFYKSGGQFDQMKSSGKVNFYVKPDVYMVNGKDTPEISSASSTIVDKIKNSLIDYGYNYVSDENDADFMVTATNFRLVYTNIVWTPGVWMDPYYGFWGGYYPWLYPYVITYATNKLLIEMVEAESLMAYRDWYQNTWKPANPGKEPTASSVPADKVPLVVWKCDISGELEGVPTRDNERITGTRLDNAFKQSAYLKAI